jgi:hypothetical protein
VEIREAIYNPETRTWVSGDLLAVRGWPGCTNVTCTRKNVGLDPNDPGECYGWHCPRCGSPTNAQGGHRCSAPLGEEQN